MPSTNDVSSSNAIGSETILSSKDQNIASTTSAGLIETSEAILYSKDQNNASTTSTRLIETSEAILSSKDQHNASTISTGLIETSEPILSSKDQNNASTTSTGLTETFDIVENADIPIPQLSNGVTSTLNEHSEIDHPPSIGEPIKSIVPEEKNDESYKSKDGMSNKSFEFGDLDYGKYEDIDVRKDPDFTDGTKMKLIYSEAPFSDDHLFYIEGKESALCNMKSNIFTMKADMEKFRANGETNKRETCVKKLEELEQSFVQRFVYKVKYEENLPIIESLPEVERHYGVYFKKSSLGTIDYTVNSSAAQIKMQSFLRKLRKHVYTLKHSGNKYASIVENFLFHKEKEYKELFDLRLKTSHDLELEKMRKLESRVPWFHEVTDDIKKDLMYKGEHNSKDHKFWVDGKNKTVEASRIKLKEIRNILEQAIVSGIQGKIAFAREALEKKEEYFINKHIKKIEIEETEPKIQPLSSLYRRSMHGLSACEIFKTEDCPEQRAMLREMKSLKRNCHKLELIGNKFAPKILNHLYHLEHEYKNKFLTFLTPDTEQNFKKVVEENRQKKKDPEKRRLKKERQMKRQLEERELFGLREVKKKMTNKERLMKKLHEKDLQEKMKKKDVEPLASWELKASLKEYDQQNLKPKRRKPFFSNERHMDKGVPKNMSRSINRATRTRSTSNDEYMNMYNQSYSNTGNIPQNAFGQIQHDVEPEFNHRERNNSFNAFPLHRSWRNNDDIYKEFDPNHALNYPGRNLARQPGFELSTSDDHSKNVIYHEDFGNMGSSPLHINRPEYPLDHKNNDQVPITSYDNFYQGLDLNNYPIKKPRQDSPPPRSRFELQEYIPYSQNSHNYDGGYIQSSRSYSPPHGQINDPFFEQNVPNSQFTKREKVTEKKGKTRGINDMNKEQKRILNEARQLKTAKGYKHLWTRNTRIYMRKSDNSPIIQLRKYKDLRLIK